MYYSNLPTDENGNIRKNRGRTPGARGKLSKLTRDMIVEVFEMLGGVDGMIEWARSDPRNLHAFYAVIYPRVLGVQPRLTFYQAKPRITRIESVIVDPGGTVPSTRP